MLGEFNCQINDVSMFINSNGIHVYTQAGMLTIVPMDNGVLLNARNMGTKLEAEVGETMKHLATVRIVAKG